ncbi:isoleucine--tRNA ligase [Patescibacteria group bacterium]
MSLKIKNYQKRQNLPELEHQVLDFWDKTKAFEKSVANRDSKKSYVFYDGPPFATGLPHYGHILSSTTKDVIPRYWTMKGYRVERVWGWDCHGLPIENIIEKELDLKGGKKGIEAMGIDKFNAACKSAVLRFDKEWGKTIRRMGRWVDFANSYKTMDTNYMESVWWAFQQLYKKDLVYEGKKVILYCPRCSTPLSNFEIAMDNSYKEIHDTSTIYKYPVKGEKDTYLLAWSTTPWNKLATPALAVHPKLTYVKVKQGNEFYILAKNTLKILDDKPHKVVAIYKGKDLEKIEFEEHFQFYKPKKAEKHGIIIADDFVTDEEGTGVVTLAIYGEDDYRVMKKHQIQMIEHVDEEGKLKPEVKPWANMFILKADPLINQELEKRNLIYRNDPYHHRVPTCYRCDTRLYYAPIPAWFINIQKLKPKLVKANQNINWYPSHLKHGRFGKGIKEAPDWNISRSRYWGTPMPIWVGKKTGKLRIIGSIEELKKWAVDQDKAKKITDIHREYIDDIQVWVDDKKTEKGQRVKEVFDCWVESGSMSFASNHYPFENKQKFEDNYPAQFISEYIAQTRAWFYTLHVMSVALFDKPSFENVLTTGTIMAADGTKMSKSKKNFPDPSILIEKYGVDALRFYLMSSSVMKADNPNFSEDSVKEIYQKLINILWNVFSFYQLYIQKPVKNPKPDTTDVLDKWLVSLTNSLVKQVTTHLDNYNTVKACQAMQAYVSDLSTWYLRRSRDRLKNNQKTQATLAWALETLSKVMAPVTPFISEAIYHNLIDDQNSVHLTDWPKVDQKAIHPLLEKNMDKARKVVEMVHSQRKEKKIKVRQPLAKMTVSGKKFGLPNLHQVILDETNFKKLEFTNKGKDLEVKLDTKLTPKLKAEGEAREIVRTVQQLRKEAGTELNESINLELDKWPKDFTDYIKAKTLTKEIKQAKTAKVIRL